MTCKTRNLNYNTEINLQKKKLKIITKLILQKKQMQSDKIV